MQHRSTSPSPIMPRVPVGGLGQAVKCGQAVKGQLSLIYPISHCFLVRTYL